MLDAIISRPTTRYPLLQSCSKSNVINCTKIYGGSLHHAWFSMVTQDKLKCSRPLNPWPWVLKVGSATPNGVASCLRWGRKDPLGFAGVAQSKSKRSKMCNFMLTDLSYVRSHIVDNLPFCSLDPYLLGHGVAK